MAASDGGHVWPSRSSDLRIQELTGNPSGGSKPDDVFKALRALGRTGSLDDMWHQQLAAQAITDTSEPFTEPVVSLLPIAPISLTDFTYIREPTLFPTLVRIRWNTSGRLTVYNDAFAETHTLDEPDIGVAYWHEDSPSIAPATGADWDYRCSAITAKTGTITDWNKAIGTWFDAGSTDTWTATATGAATITSTFQIRDASTLVLMAEASLTFGTTG